MLTRLRLRLGAQATEDTAGFFVTLCKDLDLPFCLQAGMRISDVEHGDVREDDYAVEAATWVAPLQMCIAELKYHPHTDGDKAKISTKMHLMDDWKVDLKYGSVTIEEAIEINDGMELNHVVYVREAYYGLDENQQWALDAAGEKYEIKHTY